MQSDFLTIRSTSGGCPRFLPIQLTYYDAVGSWENPTPAGSGAETEIDDFLDLPCNTFKWVDSSDPKYAKRKGYWKMPDDSEPAALVVFWDESNNYRVFYMYWASSDPEYYYILGSLVNSNHICSQHTVRYSLIRSWLFGLFLTVPDDTPTLLPNDPANSGAKPVKNGCGAILRDLLARLRVYT